MGDEELVLIESQSNPGLFYTVNLELLKCNCPDYLEKRHNLDMANPERLCKHLTQAMLKVGVPAVFATYADKILACGESMRGFPTGKTILKKVIEGVSVEIWMPTDIKRNAWVDVYLEEKRYGYNPYQARWAGETEPTSPKSIVLWIHELVNVHLPESLPEDAIHTVSSKLVRGYYRVAGDAGDMSIVVEINPRANWQPYVIEGHVNGTVNVKDGVNWIPEGYKHIKAAVTKWISDEWARIRKEIKEAKANLKKAKKK